MINKIIAFSIKNKFIIGLFILSLIGVGLYSMMTINLGSVPDITNNQVQVITVSENLSTEDIEQFVTYPVELAMGNLPGVTEIRSVSRFGLSVVTIVFEDDMGTYLPRQLVQEKLSELGETIPENFGSPSMGPISSGLGQIYEYSIQVDPAYEDQYTPDELRTIQDWIIKRQMVLLEGVIEVNSFGGGIKQYEVAISPDKLNAMGVSISEVYEAMSRNNVNTGGAYIEKNKMANFIRGEGLIRSLEDIENIVLGERQFVYRAAYEGKIAAENAMRDSHGKADFSVLPWVIFTDPQVAGVGTDEQQAEEAGLNYQATKLTLDNVPRSIAARDTRGFIKLIRNKDNDHLIGARILAPEGSELLMELALAMRHGVTIQSLKSEFHPYLTLSEGIKLAALTFDKDVKKLSCCAV